MLGNSASGDSDITDAPNHAEARSAPLVGFLMDSLGAPTYFGVNSWIRVLYLVAGAAAAIFAVLALRQSAPGPAHGTLCVSWVLGASGRGHPGAG